MKNRTNSVGWVIFSLFVWLHLALFIFPLPFQQKEEIKTQSLTIFERMDEARMNGEDDYIIMEKKMWEEALTYSYWNSWIINSAFFTIGIFSTFLLYKNNKYWPVFLSAVSIFYLAYHHQQYISMDTPLSMWAKMVETSFKVSNYQLFYNSLIWPLYLLTLAAYSLTTLVRRRKNHA